MNKRRMESLAKFIEKLPPEHFNMSEWIITGEEEAKLCKKDILDSCGTTCCIAGWQGIKAGYCLDFMGFLTDKKGVPAEPSHASSWTREYLQLNHGQAYTLFRKHTWPPELRDKKDSPELAAKRIRLMIQTGL